ncbi:hypothetical protein GCM10009633_08580 [Janibacter melonis]|uniref:hypothetical protein n=1 Tax=Janibacter melonis TaxID=262209 RepID=UPI001E48CCB5|nr:hypothetical protein [Janibacter melonis]MCB5991823.1 hypothetical protein [Janibacter melonis]
MEIDLPHLDDSALAGLLRADVPGALLVLARRVEVAGTGLEAAVLAVRRCGELEWRSGAADLYEREVSEVLAGLAVVGRDITALVRDLEVLSTTVAERLDLVRAARLPVIGLLP